MIHPEQPRIIDSAGTPEIAPTSAVETILRIGDPMELRKRLLDYINQHSESEVNLVDLAGALYAFAPDSFSDLTAIRQKFETMLGRRKRVQTSFSEYLREYLRQTIRNMAVRAVNWRKVEEARAIGQESAREVERARQEALARDRAEAAEVEKLVPAIRQKILAEMEQRTPHLDHLSEHQEEISFINKKNKIRHGRSSREDIEEEKLSREREYLLGALMEKRSLFGPKTRIYHTDTYDDYTKQADLAATIEGGPTMLIDLTHHYGDTGEKFYFNQQNPLRILEYPPHPDLSGKRGVPIIIGISKADADEAISQFLKSEAKERLGMVPDAADQKVYQESFGRWVEYILLQLEHQQNYILKHSQGIEDDDLTEDYKDALKIYEEAIEYFQELKKKRYPFVQLNEKRSSWDRRILDITSEIRDHETREGLGEHPPVLPELTRAA